MSVAMTSGLRLEYTNMLPLVLLALSSDQNFIKELQ